MVRRVRQVSVALMLVLLTLIAVMVTLGHNRDTLVVAYEGVCVAPQEGVCLHDLRRDHKLYYSDILGASWKADMSLATTSNQGRVLIQTPRGDTIHKLTSTTHYFAAPKWAPDGTHILYEAANQSRSYPDYGLWLENVVTQERRQLAEIPVPSFNAYHYWSPDRSQLVYFGTEQKFGFIEMWLCNVPTATCEPQPLAAHHTVSWTADGQQIVYTPGGNLLQFLNSGDGSAHSAVRVFQPYYDQLLAATTPATIYYNLIEFPLMTHAGLLFTHGHERRVYKLTADGEPVLISEEKFDTPELYPLAGREEVLLLDQYHTFNTDRIEVMTLHPTTHAIEYFTAVDAWRFIGVVKW